MVENTLGVLHNITKNLENIRKHPKKGREPSLPGMLLPVMRNDKLCTTTIVRKKRGKNSHFRVCAEHTSGHMTDITSGQGHFRSRMHHGLIPAERSPWNRAWTALIYYSHKNNCKHKIGSRDMKVTDSSIFIVRNVCVLTSVSMICLSFLHEVMIGNHRTKTFLHEVMIGNHRNKTTES